MQLIGAASIEVAETVGITEICMEDIKIPNKLNIFKINILPNLFLNIELN